MKKLMKLDWLMIFFAIFGAYTLVRFGIVAVQWPGMIPNDYSIFHRTAARLFADQAMYVPFEPSPFKYSPTFAAVFAYTLHQFPVKLAWFFWCVLSIVPFGIGSWALLARGLPRSRAFELEPVLLMIFATLAAWHGYLELFSYGQADSILIALLFGAWALDASERPRTKAREALLCLCMAAALAIKPQSAIFLAYFLMQRKFKLLAGIAGAFALVLLAPLPLWGSKLFEYFAQWKECLSAQNTDLLTGNLNQSLAAILARVSGKLETMLALSKAFIAAAGIFAVARAARFPKTAGEISVTAKARIFAIVAALYLVVTPLSWRWVSFWWMPIGAFVAIDAFSVAKSRAGKALLYAALAVSVFLHKNVAEHFGIEDTEPVSYWGLYGAVNLLLLLAAVANERTAKSLK